MFRSLAMLATFTLIGGLLYKYNDEVFGQVRKLGSGSDTTPNNANQAPQNNAAAPVNYNAPTNKRA